MSTITASMPLASRRTAHRAPTPALGTLRLLLAGLFSGRRRTAVPADTDSTEGLSRMEPTRPAVSRREQAQVERATPRPATPSSLRAERVAQRDRVFQLVRESMVRAGVLSSGYKFKVLSLDQRGAQFLVMMDLAAEFGGQTERLAEIEALIAQSAKHRHGILVQSVYWRFNEHVVLGRPVQPAAVPPVPAAVPHVEAEPVQLPAPRYEPISTDEVAAFKRALAIGAAPIRARPSSSGLLLTGYEDTEVVDENEGMPVLSATQYGDLPAA